MSDPDPLSVNSEKQPAADEFANDEQTAKVEDFDFDFNEDFEGEIEDEYKAILDWQFDNDAQGVSQPYFDEDEEKGKKPEDGESDKGACGASE